jgi:UDP-N-acetylmuramyl tripeptide synthase
MVFEERESAYFEDSRRLTGPNFFFAPTGALLEAKGPAARNPAAHQRWQHHVETLANALGWSRPVCVARLHNQTTSLALSAPIDQLFTATEVNEWAWETTTAELNPALVVSNAFGDVQDDIGDFSTALKRLKAKAQAEQNDLLRVLLTKAADHHFDSFLDDETWSIGGGKGNHAWPVGMLPSPDAFETLRSQVHNIPTALVTGSNGKTTTVRLIAAMAAANHWCAGYSSTEGVYVGGEENLFGDYSGPAGARAVQRDRRVDCAVLETARGGMLRRGLAVSRADVAVVTNISADHFGEYGVDSLADLAAAKLIVARAVERGGTLVLNADDAILMGAAVHSNQKKAFFGLDWHHPSVVAQREAGQTVCAVRDGYLLLAHAGNTIDFGAVAGMPLTAEGTARYNIANIAAAVLAATGLGISESAIRHVLATFGTTRHDNPGRLERWTIDGVEIILDYAHNPAGLSGVLQIARALQRKTGGRLGLLLGQAGNREDADVHALAKMAAGFSPDLIILKDIDGMLRGRLPGEIPAMLEATLLAANVERSRIHTVLPEADAAKQLVRWARSGDVVVLPLHGVAPRVAIRHWLDAGAKD